MEMDAGLTLVLAVGMAVTEPRAEPFRRSSVVTVGHASSSRGADTRSPNVSLSSR